MTFRRTAAAACSFVLNVMTSFTARNTGTQRQTDTKTASLPGGQTARKKDCMDDSKLKRQREDGQPRTIGGTPENI